MKPAKLPTMLKILQDTVNSFGEVTSCNYLFKRMQKLTER